MISYPYLEFNLVSITTKLFCVCEVDTLEVDLYICVNQINEYSNSVYLGICISDSMSMLLIFVLLSNRVKNLNLSTMSVKMKQK